MLKKKKKRNRIIDRDAHINVKTVALYNGFFSDIYYHFLNASWFLILIIFLIVFIIINVVFSLLYINYAHIANAWDAYDYFFFSIHTITTIGYGYMYPVDFKSNLLVAVEAFTGVIMFSCLAGVVFAKFSIPHAKVMFTNNAIIWKRNEQNLFSFRLANQRGNHIVDARISAYLLKMEKEPDGSNFRHIYDLKLHRNIVPTFSLTITIKHIIDENSPFYNETIETLRQKEAFVIITITGIDETMSQTIYSKHAYIMDDIIWGGKFKDLDSFDDKGQRYFDYSNFHIVE